MSTPFPPEITRVADLDTRIDPHRPVVTLFSGGLDSTYLLHLLRQRGAREVIAVAVDLGGNLVQDEIRVLGDRFNADVRILDRQDLFVEEFIHPAVQAQAIYLGLHPISSSLTRPLLAREAVAIAAETGATAILHTANRSQNTLRRLNGAFAQLGWKGAYGSPFEAQSIPRVQKQTELGAAGLDDFACRLCSIDANIWCREFEAGILDDPENIETAREFYKWTATLDRRASTVALRFREGIPTALDGDPIRGPALLDRLNRTAGAAGLGRYTGLEHLESGEKVLEIREMPAAEVLLSAYRHLESATVDAETIREKRSLEQIWTREALEGRWYGLLRRASQSFIGHVARNITGIVTFDLTHGKAELTSIQADAPLYIRDREAWEKRLGGQRSTWARPKQRFGWTPPPSADPGQQFMARAASESSATGGVSPPYRARP